MLQLDNVSKTFYSPFGFSDIVRFNFKNKSPVQALDNVSFQLEEGKILGILGLNGAGKTTLLKIISTLILPDSGKVRVNSYEVGKDDDNIKRSLGLASSEERSFYWRLTGAQNLEFFAAMYGLNKKEALSRIQELFCRFDIDYGQKRFDSYSTGMKRAFSLIRAVLHNPKLLLLDEPTKSLDYLFSRRLKNFIIHQAKAGTTIVLATHDLSEAESLCEQFLILDQGKVYGRGTLAQLKEKIDSPSASLTDIYIKLTQHA